MSKMRDHDFDDYLEGRSQLSALYRETPQDGPPARVDARVLAAAGGGARSRPRWRVPVALAATLVLGIGLVTLMQRETPEAFAPTEPLSAPLEVQSTGTREADRVQRRQRPSVAPAAAPEAVPGRLEVAPLKSAEPKERLEERIPSPEAWLERITELRRQGQTAQAEASLRAFRERYPDYPLVNPADSD